MKLSIEELQLLESEMLKEVSGICRKHDITYFVGYGTCIGAVRHSGPIPWDADADIVVPYQQLDKFIAVIRDNLPEKYFLDFHDINPYYTATFPRVGLKGYSTVTLHIDIFIVCGLPKKEKARSAFIKKTYKLRQMHYYKIASEKYRGRLEKKHKLRLLFFKILLLPLSIKKIRKQFYAMCNEYDYSETEYITNPSGGYGAKEIIPRAFLGSGSALNYTDFIVIAPEKIDLYLKHFYGDYMTPPSENERQTRDTYHIHRLELD